MAEKTKQQPKPEPIVLRENCIFEGQFFAAGDALPFTREEDLPEALRPLVATGDEEPFFSHAERNIYFGSPGGRGRARRILGNVQWQETREDAALAAQVLPDETQEALEAEHDLRIAKLKGQAAYNQSVSDAAYAQAEGAAAAKETQFYVKRGGEWGRVQNAKLRPGEPCFVRRPNGEYEASGYVNAEGEPPDPEIYL